MEKQGKILAGKLTISYDQDGDLLEIAFGSVRPAISEELVSNLFVRYDLATYDEEKNEGKEIIGFTVANISLWKDEDFRRLNRLFPSGVLKERTGKSGEVHRGREEL